MASISNEKTGVASDIYKMASLLRGVLGMAISAVVYNGVSQGQFFTKGATYGLITNILFCVLAILSIVFVIPKKTKETSLS